MFGKQCRYLQAQEHPQKYIPLLKQVQFHSTFHENFGGNGFNIQHSTTKENTRKITRARQHLEAPEMSRSRFVATAETELHLDKPDLNKVVVTVIKYGRFVLQVFINSP